MFSHEALCKREPEIYDSSQCINDNVQNYELLTSRINGENNKYVNLTHFKFEYNIT